VGLRLLNKYKSERARERERGGRGKESHKHYSELKREVTMLITPIKRH